MYRFGDQMNLRGKTALVTGAGRGLGKAIAEKLGQSGADVIVNYRVNNMAAEQLAGNIAELGVYSVAVRADVSRADEVASMRSTIENQLGRKIDVLVNNAGDIYRPASWSEISPSDEERTLMTNLGSTLICTREFASGMADRGEGRVVNISSTYAFAGTAQVLAYTAAKAGVISATRGMARELGGKNVLVNCVVPGNFETDLSSSAGSEFQDWVRSTTPVGRFGYPHELADAVAFLVASDFITGAVLVVDGGHSLNL